MTRLSISTGEVIKQPLNNVLNNFKMAFVYSHELRTGKDLVLEMWIPTSRISYWINGEQDIPDVIELFKMRYYLLKPNTKLVTRTI